MIARYVSPFPLLRGNIASAVITSIVLGLVFLSVVAGQPALAQTPEKGAVSGLPIPRFVSLKSDRVNVRGGPTKDHDVVWVYTNAGLPVEITAEFENWRRIRDWEGAEGWIYHSLLSGKRTAMVTLKSSDDLIELYDVPDPASAVAARLQSGVKAVVKKCTGAWCRIVGKGFDGWIAQQRLWGVYPGEKVD